VAAFRGQPDEVFCAVEVRMARQRVLGSGERRFAVVVEEAALYFRIGTVDMMAEQLAHLMSIGLRPNVSLSIVPLAAERTMWSSSGFWMFDDAEVAIETHTAALTITQPREIETYARVFAALSQQAVIGAQARALIVGAIDRIKG
jgi:hypothetical protein